MTNARFAGLRLMNVNVARARAAEAPIIANLMELYLYDFTELGGPPVGDDRGVGRVTGRAWSWRNERPLGAEEPIQQRGFSDVRPTDERGSRPLPGRRDVVRGQRGDHLVQELVDAVNERRLPRFIGK